MMILSALLLAATLPTSWLIVGVMLMIVTVISLFLCVLKSREAASLKKEVMELRDTMRMMRYEEANLSRMLHTADKQVMAVNEDMDETPLMDGEDDANGICEDQPACLPVEQPQVTEDAYVEKEETSEDTSEDTEAAMVEEPVAEDPVPEEPAQEEPVAEEPETEEPAQEEPVAEEPETEEPAQEEPVAEEPETEEPAQEEPVAEEPETEEPAQEEPVAEEPEAEEPAQEEPVAEEPVQEESQASKPHKQSINERRPAIPTDLFAAWFEENERLSAAEEKGEDRDAQKEQKVQEEPVAEIQHVGVSSVQEHEEETIQTAVEEAPDAPESDTVALAAEDDTLHDVDDADASAAASVAPTLRQLSKDDERFCNKLERIVNTRMRNPNLNIDVIASQFGMGRTNFYRKVRELMGMSPNDYLRKCRMERAAELLKTTELAVADVCVQVGIPDAQYFSRVFKIFYGMTPTAYREQQ